MPVESFSPSYSSVSSKMKGSTFDELSMQQSLLFSDSLKDLKNLRSQLYSAAEYFELSYTNDDQKQMVMNTIKDYTIKALVNTVDHLGSVSFRVNGLLDEKVDEIIDIEVTVSCIEQRLRTCQEYTDREGLSQQSLMIVSPKYHKRYIIPDTSIPESGRHAVAKHEELNTPENHMNSKQFQAGYSILSLPALQSTMKDKPPSFRKGRSPSPSSRLRSSSPLKLRSVSPSPGQAKHSGADKRASSPLKKLNLLARSGSLSSRPALLNSSSTKPQYPREPQKSSSMRLHAERNDDTKNEHPSKSFLKSLLTRRRSRKDDMLYNYLDEY